jgi:hypothetical protein
MTGGKMTERGEPDQPAGGDVDSAGFGTTINRGVSISGNSVSGINVGGDGSHFTVIQGAPPDDRLAQIERLVQELQAAASKLQGEQPEQVHDDAGRLLGELKQRRPDRERITHLLGRISQAAVPFASLVDIVAQIKGLF